MTTSAGGPGRKHPDAGRAGRTRSVRVVPALPTGAAGTRRDGGSPRLARLGRGLRAEGEPHPDHGRADRLGGCGGRRRGRARGGRRSGVVDRGAGVLPRPSLDALAAPVAASLPGAPARRCWARLEPVKAPLIALEEATWTQVAGLDPTRTVVFLLSGPVEQHGPHLPLGSDLFQARL
ncbi:MAG TPA: creatininase family protein, partial [Candidatus Dormibacteraeota bacterium]|nr:creatininase family protein [Candidatus Dormibacteraeota bacterium]